VAAVFHWSLASLEAMTLDELVGWRSRAIERWNRMNRTER